MEEEGLFPNLLHEAGVTLILKSDIDTARGKNKL